MKKIISVLITVLFCAPVLAADKVHVVASIKPLQLLMHELLGEQGDVKVLLPPGATPHHYSLKPSDMRKLTQADLVVWVGEDLEQFLVKPLDQVKRPSLAAYKGEEGETHEEHHDEHADEHDAHKEHDHHDHDKHDHHKEHDDHKEHASHKGHDHHEKHHEDHHDEHKDGHHKGHGDHAAHEDEHGHDHHDHAEDIHIWLNPIAMSEFAEEVTHHLVKRFPQLEAQLEENLASFQANLMATDKQIGAELAPYQAKGFVVFHDAFSEWVKHYELTQLAHFTVDPARAIGARKLGKIQTLIKEKDATCVFIEPQFKAAVVSRVVEGTDVNMGMIDPLATDTSLDEGYTGYIRQLSANMVSCLK